MTRTSRPARAAAVGALLGPPAVTALLLALGYRLVPLGGVRGATPVVLYAVALAALGATVAAAYRLELSATVVVAVAAVVGAAHVGLFGSGDVLSFLAASLFLAAAVPVVAVGEFAVRNPAAAKREVSPRTARLAAAVGVGHLVSWVVLRSVVWGAPSWRLSAWTAGLWVWLAVGGVALGAVPVVVWRERRLVAPGAVVAGAFAWAAWTTLAGPGPDETAAAASALTAYGVGWFGPLAVALAAGAFERATRRVLSRRFASP